MSLNYYQSELLLLRVALTVTMCWRGSRTQMCTEQLAALEAAGLARRRRTAALGHTVYCSHTESGNGQARLLSPCA